MFLNAVFYVVNLSEVCIFTTRILAHENIYDKFMSKVIERTKAIKMGNPLDGSAMMGTQTSNYQNKKN